MPANRAARFIAKIIDAIGPQRWADMKAAWSVGPLAGRGECSTEDSFAGPLSSLVFAEVTENFSRLIGRFASLPRFLVAVWDLAHILEPSQPGVDEHRALEEESLLAGRTQ